MFKLSFFVPKKQAEEVKQALFDAGAGRFRNYDCCSWEVEGTGQFRPLNGADPFIGEVGKIERIKELKVEMIVNKEIIGRVLETLINSHPYEEPAYEYWKINSPVS